MGSDSGGSHYDAGRTSSVEKAITDLIQDDNALDAISRLEIETEKFVKLMESKRPADASIGLNNVQISMIIDSIVRKTNVEYSEGSLKRSLDNRPAHKNRKLINTHIKVSPTILNLKAGQTKRLIETLIPNSEVNGKTVVKLCHWALGNRHDLNENSVLLPILRWLNCILHYELCSSKPLEALYELFLHSLDNKSLRTILLDILYKVTGLNKNLVTSFRVSHLLELRSKYGEMSELENLLKKYKMLKPDLLIIRINPPKTSSYLEKGSKSKMERNFDCCWSNRTSPLKQRFEARNSTYCRMETTKFGKTALDHGDQYTKSLIPSAFYNAESLSNRRNSDHMKSFKVKGNIKLKDCQTLGDMFANIHQLILPCQAMSLINSPHLFYLIMLNPRATEMKERLSFTLYHTLHNEFFSQTSGKGDTVRKKKLLRQINDLQEWQQSGIPIVYRFLAEYVSTRWNGSDFFLEILRLIAYLPITEFEELNDCLLQHIRIHYNNKFTSIEQLMVLTYLHKLITHWCVVEYERCLLHTGKQNYTNISKQQSKGEPEKNRATSSDPNILKNMGFFTCGERITEEDGEPRYVGDEANCENPLRAILDLTDLFKKWTELALAKFFRWNRTTLAQSNYGNSARRSHFSVFINEILLMYLSLSKCFIDKGIPIRPVVPSSIIYKCVFSSSSHLISLACLYISTLKNEIIPMCKNKAKNLSTDGIALEQIADLTALNAITKDMLAMFANESIAINRGESIFKKHWDIEHEAIIRELSLSSHPALLHYAIDFSKESAKDTENDDFKTIYNKLKDSDSFEYRSYIEYLEEKVPHISGLLKDHRMVYSASHVNKSHSIISNTTSGIGSMKPASGISSINPRKRHASASRSAHKRNK